MIPDDSYKYHVGDLIKIRQVKDIPIGHCIFGWNAFMADWCGQMFTIAAIEKLNGDDLFIFVDMSREMMRWAWSRDMIEPVTSADIITDSEVNELVFNYM